MAPKRRDNKGRILQMGEWQEPNGRYRYIYNDALGKRKIIYSWRLTEADSVPAHKRKDLPFREKEKQVQSLFMQGISGSDLTVIELVERYISLKTGVKQSTLANYKTVINTLQMNAYYNFLQKNNISLELVIKWFFEEYLKEEFGADGFVYNPSKNDASWLDKCKNISSEMDGVLKQYRMYVEDGQIDRELLEMSSEHIVLGTVPSFLKEKYAYAESTDMHNKMHLLFSDQSTIAYTEKTKSTYNSFCLLIMSEEMRRSEFFEYQLPSIDWLIEKNVVYVDNNDVLRLNREYVAILADMYKHEVVCVQYYGKYKPVLTEMKDSNDIRTERTLFSIPETNYLNYMLNRAEYSNGKDLRNKYIHSTYPMDEDVQMQDYMDLLKIMIIIIGKINEEFLIKCTKSDENNQ